MSANLDAALDYSARGWRVLPLHEPTADGCTCREATACASAGKHPRLRWPPGDVVPPAQVRQWWRRWPTANVGIVTGAVSNLLVVDVDPKNGGWKSLNLLERRYGNMPTGAIVVTGSAGLHFYFAHPGVIIGPSAGKLGAGLDVRCDRGLVVAPPSLHASGNRYEWQGEPGEPGPCPRWLVRALMPAPPRRVQPVVLAGDVTRFAEAVLDRAARKVREAPDGAKHDVLWRQAFHLGTFVGAGLFGEAVAEQVLIDALGDRPRSERAAAATVRRNIAQGRAKPAQVAS